MIKKLDIMRLENQVNYTKNMNHVNFRGNKSNI